MMANKSVKKIKKYSIISFVLPLIAINLCLLLFKYFGDINYKVFPNLNWVENEHSYKYNEYREINTDLNSYSLVNCPKYQYTTYFNVNTGESLKENENNLEEIYYLKRYNRITSVSLKKQKELSRAIKRARLLALI